MRLTTALSNNYIPAVGGLCWESDDCMVCSKGCRDCKVSGSSASEEVDRSCHPGRYRYDRWWPRLVWWVVRLWLFRCTTWRYKQLISRLHPSSSSKLIKTNWLRHGEVKTCKYSLVVQSSVFECDLALTSGRMCVMKCVRLDQNKAKIRQPCGITRTVSEIT